MTVYVTEGEPAALFISAEPSEVPCAIPRRVPAMIQHRPGGRSGRPATECRPSALPCPPDPLPLEPWPRSAHFMPQALEVGLSIARRVQTACSSNSGSNFDLLPGRAQRRGRRPSSCCFQRHKCRFSECWGPGGVWRGVWEAHRGAEAAPVVHTGPPGRSWSRWYSANCRTILLLCRRVPLFVAHAARTRVAPSPNGIYTGLCSADARRCSISATRCARATGGPLTRKRHTMPHSAQPQHTKYWAPRTRKRHQQEHRPQRPTESSDPTQHAKGRTGDRPGPRKGATTRRNVTQGGG